MCSGIPKKRGHGRQCLYGIRCIYFSGRDPRS